MLCLTSSHLLPLKSLNTWRSWCISQLADGNPQSCKSSEVNLSPLSAYWKIAALGCYLAGHRTSENISLVSLSACMAFALPQFFPPFDAGHSFWKTLSWSCHLASCLNIVTQRDWRVLILVNKMGRNVQTFGSLLNLTAVFENIGTQTKKMPCQQWRCKKQEWVFCFYINCNQTIFSFSHLSLANWCWTLII